MMGMMPFPLEYTMKRTLHIRHARFRKQWRYRIAPLALAVGATFILAGCEKADETVSLYQNADDCTRANPSMKEQCNTTYNNALQEAQKTAPKYATREECVAAFGESQCTQSTTTANASSHQQGSFWMPLMAGFMMGKLMGGNNYSQQPIFRPNPANNPAGGQYVDASGRSYGNTMGRTITVPREAMAPKPATHAPSSSITTTRGGFGGTVNQMNSAPLNNSAPGNHPPQMATPRATTNTAPMTNMQDNRDSNRTGSSYSNGSYSSGSSSRQSSSEAPARRSMSFGG